MIVVAILAIGLAVAIFSIQTSREGVSLERATAEIRAAIEQSRSLAMLAGARAGTPRLLPGANCAWTMGNQMEVNIDPGARTVTYPSKVQGVDAAGNMTVECEVWDLADVEQAGSGATFTSPAAATNFAFTSSGRLVGAAPGPPPSILVRITSPTQNSINGFRILPSGVLCQSSDPAPSPATPCDEQTNW
jgi:hypothetical protein